MAVTTLDTISALLGFSTLTEPLRQLQTVALPPLPLPATSTSADTVYTLDEVAEHYTQDDCWVILYDRVYDLTRFLRLHPGGADIVLENGGRDASSAFHGVGHSPAAAEMMRKYQVGVLAGHQCMWPAQ